MGARQTTENKSLDSFTVGGATVQRQEELWILGCAFCLKHLEDTLVEDRVAKAWKVFRSKRTALEQVGMSHSLRIRLIDAAVDRF